MYLISTVGNIAVGKTTFLKAVRELPYFKDDCFITIDKCRLDSAAKKVVGVDDSLEIENRAWDSFRSSILTNLKTRRVFIESSGLSWRLRGIYSHPEMVDHIYVVKLSCSSGEERKRLLQRKTPPIPFPYDLEPDKAIEMMKDGIDKLPCNIELSTQTAPPKELADVFLVEFRKFEQVCEKQIRGKICRSGN